MEERREARRPDRKGRQGASQAPRCAALRHTNRCLASTGRLSALRHPSIGVELGQDPGRKRAVGTIAAAQPPLMSIFDRAQPNIFPFFMS